MKRWEQLGETEIPGGGQLRLLRRDTEFSIRINGTQGDLMNSRMHSSEDALGELACEHIADTANANVLVGGLGMGFTLTAALATLNDDAYVVVAELVSGVVAWNRVFLGECAGFPLNDQRTRVVVADVAAVIAGAQDAFDAILLDVDNGPEALTHDNNDGLYSISGLNAARTALRDSGVLAVWSASSSPKFSARLKKSGFKVVERQVRAHKGKGARHVIWLAKKITTP